MFNERELVVIGESLDALRGDLVKIYSACREVGSSVERVKKEIEEVESLKIKINLFLNKNVAI